MAVATEIRQDRRGFGLIEALKDAIARRKLYNETLAELRSLSTRELDDLGMSRAMLTRVAAEAAYGRH
ncbi:DUF1127 domain-containing protein [Thioclava sp. GXIMD4216]|uniref:DUF1127 domain-containing protein n=1 Tax=Thioclava litoralis TaxID=3076557 RepID=A0ABZ1E2J2_9RHOB|nr:DUF1127 domain-containing protein [Thioclava sp. FTW29]